MKRLPSISGWLIVILLFSLLLVACERPLQEEVPEESLTPAPGTESEGAPGEATSPAFATLPPLATPTGGAEVPAGEATATAPTAGETPVAGGEDPADVIYVVTSGDTLGNIAERYGVTVDAIAAANGITNVHELEVGQELVIPMGEIDEPVEPAPTEAAPEEPGPAATETAPPTTEEQIYVVQPGDNLYRIGLRFGVDWQVLAQYNNISNPNRLEVGQQIRIPPAGYQP